MFGSDEKKLDIATLSAAEPVVIPQLEIEEGLDQSLIEKDNIITESQHQGTQQMMESELTPMQLSLLDVIIPRAVYRNAVKSIPDSLPFRQKFISVYESFGEGYKIGLDEVYASIDSDFHNVESKMVLAQQYVSAIDSTSPDYPPALKESVDSYSKMLEKCASVELYEHFSQFLISQSNKTTEPHLEIGRASCRERV